MMSVWHNLCVHNRLLLVIALINYISNGSYAQENLLSPSFFTKSGEIESVIQDTLKSMPYFKEALSELEETDFINQYKLAENNEDQYLNKTELVAKYGFKLETYPVQTEDYYKITVNRIPGKGDPVLLVHGLLNSAVDWFTNGQDTALPYLLADKGYDVWLMNARGTTNDSKGHVFLSPEKEPEKYWDFSLDEIGRYDLPATIDVVLNVTGKSTLKYVGHSQGTTVFFIMASERPAYNDKISLMVSLSPVAWMAHTISPFLVVLARIADILNVLLHQVLGFHEFDAKSPIIQLVTKGICGNTEGAALICNNIAYLISGFDYGQMNITQLPVIFAHTPSSVSLKQLVHYAQFINSGKFRRYDYGLEKNFEKYGTAEPPDYPVDQISVPVALFYRKRSDWLSVYEDVLTLKNKLQQVADFYETPWEKWCHTDYTYGKDAKELVYDRILELFKNY